jgi:hypothetical protein
MERCASYDSDIDERFKKYHALTKLTSLGRIKVDINAMHRTMEALPDLSHLSVTDLASLARGELPLSQSPAIETTATTVSDDDEPK